MLLPTHRISLRSPKKDMASKKCFSWLPDWFDMVALGYPPFGDGRISDPLPMILEEQYTLNPGTFELGTSPPRLATPPTLDFWSLQAS